MERALPIGPHGLPLIGTGDWNDGMNRVGEAGRGESVWLGWFFHAALAAFIPIASARNQPGGAIVKAWTATGLPAPITTTARRSAPPEARNAASIPSPSPGRPSRAPEI